jgi:benzylsuccinate CoA-transferase BbsF subunit
VSWRPLEGVRVADFCWLIAGPLTTRLLADLGAEVIKIESNARPDEIRISGIWPANRTPESPNTVFNDCNTGKRSVTLNLGHPRGIELAKEIVRRSDIVTNNFTGERMDRWGLGYDDLVQIKPDIIMMTMSVMGRTGPYRTYGANGLGVLAFSGLDTNMGFPGQTPIGMGPLYSDFAGPYLAAFALMAALHHRDQTGEGQFIDLAQAQGIVSLLGTGVLEYTANGRVPDPPGNRSREHVPHGAYPAAGEDRWVTLAARSEDEWRALCERIGRPDLASDPALASPEGRRAREEEIDEAVAAWTREHEAWQAVHLLQDAGVPAAVIEHAQDLAERDPHLRDYHFQDLTDTGGVVHYMTHGQPARFGGETIPLRRSPVLGEDNAYVFSDLLGLPDEEIADLFAEQVIY